MSHDTNAPLQFISAAAAAALLAVFAPGAARAQQSLGGGLTAQDLAPPDAAVAASLPRYLQSRSASFVDWLADGSMLVATRFGETLQVHRVRAPLSMREQLSFEPAGVLAAAAEPLQEDAFVMLSPRDGGRHAALLLERPHETALEPLTDGGSRDGAALWAHDGKRLAFSSNRNSQRDREVYLLDTGALPASPRLVAGGEGFRWQVFDWSLDDQRLLLGRQAVDSEADADLYIAELGSGEIRALELPRRAAGKAAAAEPAMPLRARSARFAPDGRGILWLGITDGTEAAGGAQFEQLRYFDPVAGSSRTISSESDHDVELFDQSPDGRYIAYTIEEAGNSRLLLVDTQRKLDIRVATLGPGLISSLKFDSTGKRLALTAESAVAPRDVYVLGPDSQQVTRWTRSELGLQNAAGLTAPTLLHYPTWDRVEDKARSLSAYGFRAAIAPGAVARARPVLILLRSGGGTEFRPDFDPTLQYLVNELGFVVLAPNVRGSSGLGQAFQALGAGALRDDAVRDVGSLLVWIGLQSELDRERVFVMGEGYGGNLALAALAQYGDRLRGGIAAFLPHRGPLPTGTSIRLPVLLVQGLGDPEAPAYESEQLAARLRASGSAVQYLAAADEAGAFRRQSHREAYSFAIANFLAPLIR